MQLLTQDNYESAITFLKTKARKLEKSIFEYEFESQSFSAVLDELRRFQNQDGGFGNALDPDLRCKESSTLATVRALEILHLNNESIDLIKGALNYLEGTFDKEIFGWDIIPKEAEQSPRAVWWNYGAFRENWGNPNADVIGFFMDYKNDYTLNNLNDLIDFAMKNLLHKCDLTEMHELFCYLHLAERLDDDRISIIARKLYLFMDNCVSINTEERSGYGATPLQVVDSPSSPYYSKYGELIPIELDNLIDQQSEDGSWEPNWSWYQFEEEWLTAKEEWKGILTLNALRILRNFNRTEN
ncbi:hypothetical protein [Paenibacillus pini]|uniref:Uncharacterized protein n=1 Tax=Paenibacillus pini JCM 16418 TaxID=1236976 RepID=W7YHB8_9BACL|nr:hypothetical protein [Paenibacillus pini]GAF07852.1 hypothetical protein JCM16418_1884 [Paenibacillus pini JCM 16418]